MRSKHHLLHLLSPRSQSQIMLLKRLTLNLRKLMSQYDRLIKSLSRNKHHQYRMTSPFQLKI